MKPTTLIAIVALVLLRMGSIDLSGLLDGIDLPSPSPVVPVEEPADELKGLVDPIGDKLDDDPDKASTVASVFAGFADAAEGASGRRLSTTGQVVTVLMDSLSDLGTSDGVSVGKEIRAAVVGHVGIEADSESPGSVVDRPLDAEDRREIVEVYRAIAWSASGAN